jgi:hypothetical protein
MNNLSNSTAEEDMTPTPLENQEERVYSPQISESGEFISSQQLPPVNDNDADSVESDDNEGALSNFKLKSTDKGSFEYKHWIVELDIIVNYDYSNATEAEKDTFFPGLWNLISQFPSGTRFGKFSLGSIRNKLVDIIFKIPSMPSVSTNSKTLYPNNKLIVSSDDFHKSPFTFNKKEYTFSKWGKVLGKRLQILYLQHMHLRFHPNNISYKIWAKDFSTSVRLLFSKTSNSNNIQVLNNSNITSSNSVDDCIPNLIVANRFCAVAHLMIDPFAQSYIERADNGPKTGDKEHIHISFVVKKTTD